jgi:hypothetical protein
MMRSSSLTQATRAANRSRSIPSWPSATRNWRTTGLCRASRSRHTRLSTLHLVARTLTLLANSELVRFALFWSRECRE